MQAALTGRLSFLCPCFSSPWIPHVGSWRQQSSASSSDVYTSEYLTAMWTQDKKNKRKGKACREKGTVQDGEGKSVAFLGAAYHSRCSRSSGRVRKGVTKNAKGNKNFQEGTYA